VDQPDEICNKSSRSHWGTMRLVSRRLFKSPTTGRSDQIESNVSFSSNSSSTMYGYGSMSTSKSSGRPDLLEMRNVSRSEGMDDGTTMASKSNGRKRSNDDNNEQDGVNETTSLQWWAHYKVETIVS